MVRFHRVVVRLKVAVSRIRVSLRVSVKPDALHASRYIAGLHYSQHESLLLHSVIVL